MKAPAPLYALSLPERTLRAAGAFTGGLLRELSEVALPAQIREAALYRATAAVGLRFLIEQVGDVRGIYSPQDPLARKFVVRYAVGTSIETLAILNFYLSPVWVLAALGDTTRLGKTLFVQIGAALKEAGLLDRDARMENMVQLLDGLERTSTHLALTVNMPPLDARALRREWAQFRSNLERFPSARLPSAGDIERSWSNLQSAATHTRRSVFQVSAAMGASALPAVPESVQWLSRSAVVAARASGMVVGEAFLKHYASASKEISRTGFSTYWAAHTRPYLVGVIRNFLPQNQSWTERLLSIQPQNPGKIKSVLPR